MPKEINNKCVTWIALVSVLLPISVFVLTMSERLHASHDKKLTTNVENNRNNLVALRDKLEIKLDNIEDMVKYNSTMVTVIREDQKKAKQ